MSTYPQTPEHLPNLLRHPFNKDLTPRFEDFLPFVHVSDEQVKQRFIDVLRELFEKTGDDWRPGGCYGTQYLTRIITQLQTDQKLSDVQFTPMQWANEHFYLTAQINGGSRPLIIDPFGVPPSGVGEETWMRNKGIITPYFGEIESAPGKHQQIYSSAGSVTNGVFRVFRP